MNLYSSIFKRYFDVIVALALLLLLTPIFVVLIFMGLLNFKEGPFFFQTRSGKNNNLFNVIKFRSMKKVQDVNGLLLEDILRITKFGKFLRNTSLDELPQLINVIIGDMSLIGPRPLFPEYYELYTDAQKKRLTVKPGLTGMAQVNGRNNISWEEKFEFDIFYIENISFKLDFSIFWKTIKYLIFSHKNVSAMRFEGTKFKTEINEK